LVRYNGAHRPGAAPASGGGWGTRGRPQRRTPV